MVVLSYSGEGFNQNFVNLKLTDKGCFVLAKKWKVLVVIHITPLSNFMLLTPTTAASPAFEQKTKKHIRCNDINSRIQIISSNKTNILRIIN